MQCNACSKCHHHLLFPLLCWQERRVMLARNLYRAKSTLGKSRTRSRNLRINAYVSLTRPSRPICFSDVSETPFEFVKTTFSMDFGYYFGPFGNISKVRKRSEISKTEGLQSKFDIQNLNFPGSTVVNTTSVFHQYQAINPHRSNTICINFLQSLLVIRSAVVCWLIFEF